MHSYVHYMEMILSHSLPFTIRPTPHKPTSNSPLGSVFKIKSRNHRTYKQVLSFCLVRRLIPHTYETGPPLHKNATAMTAEHREGTIGFTPAESHPTLHQLTLHRGAGAGARLCFTIWAQRLVACVGRLRNSFTITFGALLSTAHFRAQHYNTAPPPLHL
jgi:hypothetical protein